MLTHIKTHIQFHLSQRQFRLLLLLLTVSSEYTFLVTPGTFANGVEQILSATGTTVSQTGGAIIAPQTKQRKWTYSVASRTAPLISQEATPLSNADGWMDSPDEAPGSWIVFEKKTTNQTVSNTKNPQNTKNTSSNALPQSFDSAPSVPTYNPNYIYPTTPISETAYTMATSYPSGNPGKTVNSTTDVPEGTNLYYTTVRFIADFIARFQSAFDSAFSNKTTDNLAEGTGSLYFTDTRAQNALSGTVSSLSGRINTVEQNMTANLSGSLTATNTDISTLSGRVNILSGTVSSNYTSLLASLATKIGLTSLSATGGISYNSGTGLFSDLFTFTSGLTRVGNSIGISSITGAQLSGFTTGQLTFGTASGGLTSNSNLFWDNTNGRLGIGTNAPTLSLDVIGTGFGFRNASSWDHIYMTHDGTNALFRAGGAEGGLAFQVGAGSSGGYGVQAYTEAMRILSSGRIGIGLTAPTAMLHLKAGTATANTAPLKFSSGVNMTTPEAGTMEYNGTQLFFSPTVSARNILAQISGQTALATGSIAFAATNGYLTGSSNLFWDNTNGRLGIGTNAPLAPLHITTANATPVKVIETGTTGVWDIDNTNASNATWDGWRILKNGSEQWFMGKNGTTTQDFAIRAGGLYNPLTIGRTNGNFIFQNFVNSVGAYAFNNTAGTSILNIDSTNNRVGIGTSSPSSKLEINSSLTGASGLRFTQLLSSTASNGQYSGVLGVNSTGDVGIAQLTGNSFTGFTNGQLTFGTTSGKITQSSNLFWDNTNGRLGIGTNSPTTSLYVNGTSTINGDLLMNPNGSINRTINFGAAFGKPALTLYDGGSATLRWGWGLNSGEMQFYGTTNVGNHFSWNRGGDLQTTGVNELMRLDISTGNLGIGTSSPNSKLEIDNTTANTSGLRFTRLTSTGASSSLFSGILGVNSTGDVGIAQLTGNSLTGFTAGQLTFGTASGGLNQSSNLFWDNTNNIISVGGNAQAGAITAIGGKSFSTLSYGVASIGKITHTSGWNGAGFAFSNTTAGSNVFSMVYNTDDAWFGQLTSSSSNTMGQWNTDRLYLNTKLGIGTSTPNAKLELNSGTGGLSGLRFTQLLSSSASNAQYSGLLGVNSTGDVGLAGFNPGQLLFGSTASGLTQSSNLYWDNTNARFGLGTISPKFNLHVQGGGTSGITAASGKGLLFSSDATSGARILLEHNTATAGARTFAIMNESTNLTFGSLSDTAGAWVNNYILSMNHATGNVGIGINGGGAATKLQVSGDIRVGTSGTNGCVQGFGGATIAGTCSSDERLKTNISNLAESTSTSILDRLKNIRVVNYQWNDIAANLYKTSTSSNQIGFLAQNVESFFPELVTTNSDGYRQVNYSAMNIYAIEAIKELAQNTASTGALNTLSGQVATLSGQVALLSQSSGSTVVNNYYSSGTTSSGSSSSWIDTAFSFVSSLIVRAEATFSEMVTFMKSVVFRSTVTFEDRVTFSDKDMAGTATIRAGERSIRVDFSHPYSEIPRVTVTADAFITYRVTDKMVTGFTIETQSPVSTDTNFDWMAVLIRGLATTTPSTPSTPSSGPDTPPVPSSPSNTGSTDTGTGNSTDIGSTALSDSNTNQTTVSGEVTP